MAAWWGQEGVWPTHLGELGYAGDQGSLTSTQRKVTGIDLFSAGDLAAGEGTEEVVRRDRRGGVYQRLVLKDNRVIGAVLYGDVKDGGWYFDLIQKKTDISAYRNKLLFGQSFCEAA